MSISNGVCNEVNSRRYKGFPHRYCVYCMLAGYEQGYDRQGKADRVLVEDAVALAGKESVDAVLAVVVVARSPNGST